MVQAVVAVELSSSAPSFNQRVNMSAEDRLPFHTRGERESLIIKGDVQIDPQAILWTEIETSSFVTHPGGRIVIGRGTFINNGAWFRAKGSITVGVGCNIGPRVMVMDNDAHEIGGNHRPGGKSSPVVLEDYCWIGAGAIVLKGVTVGKHAIVGAGAVVTKSVPPRMIAAGNPARVIGEVPCE